jgi:hypothetical protein
MRTPRFDLFFEQHIGFGVRWQVNGAYPLYLSLSLPLITMTIGLGAPRGGEVDHA